jgi:hypothetical protein
LSVAGRLIRMLQRQAEWSECQNVLQADEASEMAACIGGIEMHRKSMEADGADGADRAGGEYKVSEAVKMVRTCQNSLGQDGTCLG